MTNPLAGGGGGVSVDDDRSGVFSHPVVSRIARWGVVAWSLIGVAVLGYLAYRFVLLRPIRILFPPLLIAMVIVYLLNPIVSRLERRGVHRLWGALLSYAIFLGLLILGLRLLVPMVADQVANFVQSVPDLLDRADEAIRDLNRRFDLNIDTSLLLETLGPGGSGGEFIGRIFSFTAGVLHVALVLVLGIVLGFYLLVDLPKIQRGIMAAIPARRRPGVTSIADRIGRAMGGYFRGQFLVALFVGLASMLALWIVGLPYWALVGIVAGVTNLIPLVGPFIGAIPALFIAFTTENSVGPMLSLDPGWPMAIGASLALLIVQQIDNHILSPNIVARTVRLHPVTVMLGLLVAGTLLGLWGMLLAVPVIATVKILVLYYWDTRMQWPPRPQEPDVTPAEREPPVPVARSG